MNNNCMVRGRNKQSYFTINKDPSFLSLDKIKNPNYIPGHQKNNTIDIVNLNKSNSDIRIDIRKFTKYSDSLVRKQEICNII